MVTRESGKLFQNLRSPFTRETGERHIQKSIVCICGFAHALIYGSSPRRVGEFWLF